MNNFFRDIVYALRQLRNAPAFTITAVLTLALGIGANTAVYTLVHEVLLKSLPIADPGGLYRLGETYNCCIEGDLQEKWTMFSYPMYQSFSEHSPEFEVMTASQTSRPDVSVRRPGATAAQSFSGEMVAGNYFSTLGVRAAAGRLISPTDDQQGAAPVAVISYKAWQEKYGGDPTLVGSSLTINGMPMTLIGVAAPGFYGDRRESDPPDFWTPLALEPALSRENSILRAPATAWLYVFGRLKPGATPQQASAHLTAELQQYLGVAGNLPPGSKPEDIKKQSVKVAAGGGGVNAMEDAKRQLYILLGAALVTLLIACANVANLLLSRGAATKFRTSLQLAIGASRARIIRAKLTESVVLAVLGGAAGLLLAYYASRAMVLLAFRGADYVPISAAPSWPVLGFTFLVALLTGVIFGVAPAWVASRSNPADTLRGSSRTTRDAAGAGQKILVVLQAALSLALLTMAGLLTRSLSNLQNQQFGFEREGRLIIQINPATAGYTQERLTGLYQNLEERFQHTPGVISESLALYTAQQGNNWGEGIHIQGKPDGQNFGSSWDRVGVHYFEAIGNPIVKGRAFNEHDTASSQRVAVVSEAFVQKFFPNEDPIGHHFGKGDPSHAGDYEIVGVCKDAKYGNASAKPRVIFFIPLPQTLHYTAEKMDEVVETASMYMGTIILHVAGDPRTFESQVRRTLAEVDSNLVPLTFRTFDELIQIRTSQNTAMARLCAVFGLVALLLASIGLYGLTAYQVTQRTGEIGIRMALGADRLNIMKMVLRGAFVLVAIGLVAGAALAFGGGKLLASQLFGVTAFEPMILGGAIAALAVCALLASILPARRAAGVDPMRALRTE